MKRAVVLGLALLVACSSPKSTPVVPSNATELPKAIDTALAKRLDAVVDLVTVERTVGVVIVVAKGGKIVYERAAGFADREAKTPVAIDTMFRFASMTKPIVSVAALALVDQKKLSLEDPVTKYLPEFRPKLADGTDATITVRQLITHTAGLGYKFFQKPGEGTYYKADVSDGLAEPGLSADENLRRLASVPLLDAPGTKWNYSLAIDVLGEVVAKAGGGTLPEVLARVVTKPLGMIDTTFVVGEDKRARLAAPYAAGKPPVRMTEPYEVSEDGITVRFSPARIFDAKSFPSGGAGTAGTAHDYLRFAEALRTGKSPVLSEAMARALREKQISVEFPFGAGQTFGYGVGVILDPAAAKSSRGAGSFGWGGIYGTGFWIDPSRELSVVILTNVAGNDVEQEVEKAIYSVDAR
jgi:CubicO group peptidase (beta-lactamase class C family)